MNAVITRSDLRLQFFKILKKDKMTFALLNASTPILRLQMICDDIKHHLRRMASNVLLLKAYLHILIITNRR